MKDMKNTLEIFPMRGRRAKDKLFSLSIKFLIQIMLSDSTS